MSKSPTRHDWRCKQRGGTRWARCAKCGALKLRAPSVNSPCAGHRPAKDLLIINQGLTAPPRT